jgi:anti-sigma B factor antagonist
VNGSDAHVARDTCAAGSDVELVLEPSLSEVHLSQGLRARMTRHDTGWKDSSSEMSDDLLRFEFARNGTKETLRVTGELDISTAASLEGAVARTLDGQGGAFYVDISALTFMDSTGAQTLLRLHRRLIELGRRLVIVSPTPLVRRVLEILGFDQVMDVQQ